MYNDQYYYNQPETSPNGGARCTSDIQCNSLQYPPGGSCVDGRCQCMNNYCGENCMIPSDQCISHDCDPYAQNPAECNYHGSCDEYGKCFCFSGWNGKNCTIPPPLYRCKHGKCTIDSTCKNTFDESGCYDSSDCDQHCGIY